MQELQVIIQDGLRVLTTKQIAQCYGTSTRVIANNFNRNKSRYVSGKHFVCLEGLEKREFAYRNQFEDSSIKAAKLYLWTEKGALLHAKSLNTDKAWEVYDYLVDFYFRANENHPREQIPEEKEKMPVTLTEISREDMKRIGMNRGIVMGVYRAEQEKRGCDVLDIFNRLSNHGKELAWSLIFGEVRHAQ